MACDDAHDVGLISLVAFKVDGSQMGTPSNWPNSIDMKHAFKIS